MQERVEIIRYKIYLVIACVVSSGGKHSDLTRHFIMVENIK